MYFDEESRWMTSGSKMGNAQGSVRHAVQHLSVTTSGCRYDYILYVASDVVFTDNSVPETLISTMWEGATSHAEVAMFADEHGEPDPRVMLFRASPTASAVAETLDR